MIGCLLIDFSYELIVKVHFCGYVLTDIFRLLRRECAAVRADWFKTA